MVAAALVDGYGRVHRDLRISVTDRCNFRCTYCMPVEGMTWLPRSEVLTFEEIERVARVCVENFGVDSIRLTGGEPTVRAHLPALVARLAALRVPDMPDMPGVSGGAAAEGAASVADVSDGGGRPIDLALTTNGATLRTVAPALVDAGLRRVNVSLDTLRPDRFLELTRRDQLADVLDGIEAAVEAGLAPVKVNAVVMRGVNDDEIVDMAAFGRDRGVTMRFIEWMPLDADGRWDDGKVVSQDEIVAAIDAVFPLAPIVHGDAPAERFAYVDGQGEVGVIASVTRPFCSTCDRIRLTADGQLRSCLFSVEETDLRELLRSGVSDDDLAATVARCVAGKWAGHMIGQVTFVRPRRSMSQIGG